MAIPPAPLQIYTAVISGRRPPLPADPATLPGGTFPGLNSYVALLQQCWYQQPQQRPSFTSITTRLRDMQAAWGAPEDA